MAIFPDLIETLKQLSDEMALLDGNFEKGAADYDDEIRGIEEEYDAAEYASMEVRDRQISEADARYKSWTDKLSQYKSGAEKTRSRASFALGKAFNESASQMSMDAAIRRLEDETAMRRKRHKRDDNAEIIHLCEEADSCYSYIQEMSQYIAQEAGEQREREVQIAEDHFDAEHNNHMFERDYRKRGVGRKHMVQREYFEDAFVERVEQLLLPDKVREAYEKMQYQQPNYEVYEPAKTFPAGIQFGYAGYDVTEHLSDSLKAAVLRRRFDFALVEANGRSYLAMPYGYGFDDNRFSTMFEFYSGNREQAQEEIRNLALNLYMSIPVNKCWCTFIDPIGYGGTFAMFSPLAEQDENGNGDKRAIDTRIWSSEEDIEERLKIIIDHTSDVIQRCLQARYNNILEYNKEAGINAEPLRFVVIMDFPHRFSDRALDYLESILDNGANTGVYTLIAGDREEMDKWPESSAVGRIRTRMKNTVAADEQFFYVQEQTREGHLRYFPFAGPSMEQGIRIIKGIQEHLGEKIEITYPLVSGNLPSRPEYWFNKSAQDGISVPIGMEGAGKIVNLEFGHPYGTFNAMIGGTVGSGKSTLMHTIIQSVLFNYSPDDVQMFLLDFKRGMEFRCYADYKLPNFRVISVETEPEFGLAVLTELDAEMERRSKKIPAGSRGIEDYWKYKGERGESHADMPRILVIFDEVQALLSDGESDIVKQCAEKIRVLVTQGRAFGIHLILSTQNYYNVKGLDNGVYSNIYTRIALKSNRESAALLLDSDSDVISRLSAMDPGQGVINTYAGERNANRTFRTAIIFSEERDRWLKQVSARQREVMMEEPQKPRILLSGPQDDSDNPLTLFANTGEAPTGMADPSCHLYIGESLTMRNTYHPVLMNVAGSNLLIAGRNQGNSNLSRMIVSYSILSLLHETIRLRGEITLPIFTVFDLGGTTMFGSRDLDMLSYIEHMVPEAFRIIPPNQLLNGIQTLYEELYTEQSLRQQFVIFYGLNRAKQLTTGTYQRSPKEVLEKLFAEGPERGMNFIVWANDPGLLIENYAMALNSFDNRLAYGMEDREYKAITGENGPKHIYDMNAVSYNMYGDNQKIRMYASSTEEWLNRFLTNVRNYIR